MNIIRTIAATLSTAAFFSLSAQRAKAQTTQWVRIPTDPANTPAGRESAVMVYDEKREVISHPLKALTRFNRVESKRSSEYWASLATSSNHEPQQT